MAPAQATATYGCGIWGGTTAELHATQSGSSVTIRVRTGIATPVAIDAGTMTTTLRMARNGTDVAVFTGSSNPLIPGYGAFDSGPLTSTTGFVPGDTLDSYLGPSLGLTLTVIGVTVECQATAPQFPGPFVVD
ncbi:hypothetical protein [Streptomyces mesophilus]|uniref:hypothetical protein n=1 Tax=Streptomyces mesophilus TaxID=1775132 RepID=UPI0033342D4E